MRSIECLDRTSAPGRDGVPPRVGAVRGEALPQATHGFLACIAGLAAATAFIQFAMNWAQQTVSATRATVR